MLDSTVSFSVANINPGSVRAEFMLSVMALVNQERINHSTVDPLLPRVRFDQFYMKYPCGPYLDDERNMCSLWFMDQTESDYLLFIDSDIGYNPSDALTLIETAADNGVTILTGVYYNQFFNHGGLRALVYEWGSDKSMDGHNNLLPLSGVDLDHFYPWDKPHPVDACGAGFMAIHRSCFQAMRDKYLDPQPFFAEQVIDGIHMGEDLTFCIRAKAVGHQTYVLPSIEVDHHKMAKIRRQR